ncbi:MAG: hypothetical protein E7Z77_01640 [Methanobrevibacter sp.]|uniref:hypothetical protein n=1 Tax=Methanobrevibacter sp. TaxID=66852 RepID=UPI0025D19A53|nr:hypothetical protein [Methanobrevibacter sp.]MBE6508094.1 hypothetical protein [Methanobrevibacter sp.]
MTAKSENGKTIITASIASDATGNLRITYEGVTYVEKITNGLATAIVDEIMPGSHLVEVKYNGNYKYTAATKLKTITI